MLDFVLTSDFLFYFVFGFVEGFVHLTKAYTVIGFGIREVASRSLVYIVCWACCSLV